MKCLLLFSIIFSVNSFAFLGQSQQLLIQQASKFNEVKTNLHECTKRFRREELSESPIQVSSDLCIREIQEAYDIGLKDENIIEIISEGINSANKLNVGTGNKLSFIEAYEEAKRLNTLKVNQEMQQQIQQQQDAN